MFANEEWKPVKDFPHYSISNYGRVKHIDRINARKLTVNERGFVVIQLQSATSPTRYLRQINQLVADAFLPPSKYADETSIWHIDGNLQNCRVENLRWDIRARVLEWNSMHRHGQPKFKTPHVKNNDTGLVYENAFQCALDEGEVESKILWCIEKQALDLEDDTAKYRYVFES